MRRPFILWGLAALLVSCKQAEPPKPANQEIVQCGKDTDCKGDRICDAGQCINPPPPAADKASALLTSASAIASSSTASATQEQAASSDPVPVCREGDGRVKIPVWEPTLDEREHLSSAPPQKDGQIVYIHLHHDASKVTCNNKELNSFSLPDNPKNTLEGGLSVNIRGNTQFANGTCYFKGYYMNEDAKGMHQGWTGTYFQAVSKEKIVLSHKYCLAKAIQ